MGHYLLSNRGKLRRTGSYRRLSERLIAFLGTKPVIFLLQNGLFILAESGNLRLLYNALSINRFNCGFKGLGRDSLGSQIFRLSDWVKTTVWVFG